jgi:membrane protease YdiL (CAAX protease family)
MINNTIYRYFSRLNGLFLFFICLVIPIITSALITNVLIKISGFYSSNLFLIKLVEEKEIIYLISMYVIFFLLYGLLNFVFKTRERLFSNENWFISLGKALIPAIIAFGIALVILVFITSIINLLPDNFKFKNSLILPNKALVELLDFIDDGADYKVIIWLTLIIIIAPIYEEILFRGFLQEFIENFIKYKNVDVIIISLFFALFHIPSFTNVVYAFIIGIFLSIQRKINKSINVTIWMHSLINFAGVVLAIVNQILSTKLM